MMDGVHRGHQWLLAQLIDEGRRRRLRTLVVTFANHPLTVVAPDRLPPLLQDVDSRRRQLLAAGVDTVAMLTFDEHLRHLTAREYLQMLRRDFGVTVLLMGFNHRFGSDTGLSFADYRAIGAQEGIEVIRATECPHLRVSSTDIRRALADGRVDDAAAMLGRPYSISGVVGAGRQVGRTMSFPTANIVPREPRQAMPMAGAYAAAALMPDGSRMPAMVNIGTRPTVDSDPRPTIEAHIIGFDGDLYSRPLKVELLRYLRPQRRFDSLSDLRRQLLTDSTLSQQIYEEEKHL